MIDTQRWVVNQSEISKIMIWHMKISVLNTSVHIFFKSESRSLLLYKTKWPPPSSCSNSLSCAVCVGEACISIFCFSFLHSSFQLFKKKICGKGFCIVHTYMKVFLAYFVTTVSKLTYFDSTENCTKKFKLNNFSLYC